MNASLFRLWSIHAVAVCTAISTVAADVGGPAERPVAVVEGAKPSRLIEDLGSLDWRTRNAASHLLLNRGPELYEALKQAFRLTHRFEVRRRIKQIAREIHVGETLGPTSAFLGIQHTGQSVPYGVDARVPAESTAILIMEVFPLTAASVAGLQRGDLLVSLNGKRAVGKKTALGFTQWIGAQKPGTPCQLGVFRGGKGFVLSKRDTRKFSPKSFMRAKTRVRHYKNDPRIMPRNAGILLTDVARMEREFGLEKGDLIISLDGRSIPLEGAKAVFADWVLGKPNWPKSKSKAEVDQADEDEDERRGKRRRYASSVQILRGCEYLELHAVLGRRPTFLPNGQTLPGQSNPQAVYDARAQFEAWWEEWAGPDRLSSDRFDAEADWRLDP